MSSRRSRSLRQSNSSSRMSEQQITELVSKLRTLLPQSVMPPADNVNDAASASRILEETCNCIRSLHKEVDNLSERLAELLQNTDNNVDLEAIIRSLNL